jgi:hypothetical protein
LRWPRYRNLRTTVEWVALPVHPEGASPVFFWIRIANMKRVLGFFAQSRPLISLRQWHSSSALPSSPRHAAEAPLCNRWHAGLPTPPAPSPPSARPRPWCAQHPAHTPVASRNFKLCSLRRPGGGSAKRAAPPPSSARCHPPPCARRARESCVLARSFLSRPLPRWCFGVSLSPPCKKTTLPKLSGKGFLRAFGFSRV